MRLYGLGITCNNVNQGYLDGMRLIKDHGVRQPSRYGEVRAVDGPVMVVYNRPWQRVLFDAVRDCNPFFHFMEALWMLAGRNDVAFVAQYAKRMEEFSDDGVTLHGAYGYRWRRHYWLEGEYEVDQLPLLADMLKADPTTRRAVLQMWDPVVDLLPRSDVKTPKDLPCNTQIYFRTRWERAVDNLVLDMTVCNRSNDIVWGLFGANCVHMSMLHEYMSRMTGLQMGKYVQFTNNFHAYTKVYDPLMEKLMGVGYADPYQLAGWEHYQMVKDPKTWDVDLGTFMTHDGSRTTLYSNPFFSDVAEPLRRSWIYYKEKRLRDAINALDSCMAGDWQAACLNWLDRRAYKPMLPQGDKK